MKRRLRLVMVAVVALSSWPALAVADRDGPRVLYRVQYPEVPGQHGVAPSMDVVIDGGPRDVPLSSWSLAQVDVTPALVVPATAVRSHLDDRDRLAIALVVEGHAMFMGRDRYETDPDLATHGVFSRLASVTQILSTTADTNAMGTLIVYGVGAKVVSAMQPLAGLKADAFGMQADYRDIVTRDLTDGVREAISQLLDTGASRRAIVVLGDGADTNVDEARAELLGLRKQAEQDRIDLYAVNYSAGIGYELQAITVLTDDVTIVPTVDQIPAAIQTIIERIQNRFVLTFPLTVVDDCPHDFELRLDGKSFPDADAIRTVNVHPLSRCTSQRSRGRDWSPLLVGIGFLVAVVVVAGSLYVRRRDRRARTSRE